jgi:mannosylglycerate hydrolase
VFTIHVVSHTHWDREWYLTFQQFRFRLVELMDQLLALLDADPNYRYFMLDGQAIVLEDYLEVRPEREEEIRRYVQEGRLLIGPWYILPDEFLVSPEALVRNLLLGERVCRRLGSRMKIGYIPDPFGHLGQMPQILRGFGIDVACLWRGVGDRPAELRWRAPDGSEVFLLHLRDSYSNAAWLPADEDGFVQGLAELHDSLAPHAATSHVLAMQGTDHMEPRADLPRLLAAADARLEDTRVVHSTLPRYLAAVRDELGERESRLPVICGELRAPQRAHLLPGVLSTRMWIKQRNHACQTLLERWAEPFSAVAARLQPETLSLKPLVDRAWRYLLENHPHDSICGCSVDQVHREMVTRFDWCEQIGEEVTLRVLQVVAQQISVSVPAIVVFNPASAPRSGVVSVEVEPPTEAGAALLDEAGQPVPYRTLDRHRREVFGMEVDRKGFALLVAEFRSSGGRIREQFVFRRAEVAVGDGAARVDLVVLRWEGAEPGLLEEVLERAQALLADESIQHYSVHVLNEGLRIQFVARDVPPVGYTSYTLVAGSGEQAEAGISHRASGIQHAIPSIENEFYRVEGDLDDGTLTVIDKVTGRVFPGCNRFVDGGDRGDEYNYCRPERDRPVDHPATPPAVRRLSADEVGATLEIAMDYQVPVSLVSGDRSRRGDETVPLSIVTRVTLTPGVRRVDFETTVENQAHDHRLRVHFPTDLTTDAAWADGHFDVVKRPLDVPTETGDWAEQPVPTHPQRAFVDVSDGERGVMLANRGLPEYEVLRGEDGAEIALTLLRCVGWLSRDDMHCRLGHAGPGEVTPEAQCLGQYTFHYSLIPHAGDYCQAYALAHAFQTDLRALFTHTHSSPLALSETEGLPVALSFVTVEPSTLEISAIKEPEGGAGLIVRCWNVGSEPVEGILRLWRPFRRVMRVNLAEEGAIELARNTDAVTLPVRGREVVTVRFEF